MRNILVLSAAVAIALSPHTAVADQPAPPSISVSGTGSVKYSPDIASMSLGVRAEASSAAAAAKSVNTRAQSVINALRGLGIAEGDIATSNYSIEYQPPQQPDGGAMPMPAPNQVQTMSGAGQPPPGV